MAILDTGASRCVMGANFLKHFVRQFEDHVRSRIKVLRSSVRFGNNQTLTSQKKLLLPMPAQDCTMWLSVEIVPGSTPLLFSKRAIQQLGGILDATRDSLELRRLPQKLLLQTSPGGLYMLDLPRLCHQDRTEDAETYLCSKPVNPNPAAPLTPLHVVPSPASLSLDSGSGSAKAFDKTANSSHLSKYPDTDNAKLGVDERVTPVDESKTIMNMSSLSEAKFEPVDSREKACDPVSVQAERPLKPVSLRASQAFPRAFRAQCPTRHVEQQLLQHQDADSDWPGFRTLS